MKKLTFLLMAAILAANSYAVTSYTLTGTSGNRTLTITGTGNMPNYSSGGAPWYSYRTEIKTVIINDGVTSIGNYAFNGCTGFNYVTIPNSVTSIGEGAFLGCTGFHYVTIPNSVTTIGIYAFRGCTSFTNIEIPNNIVSIGNNAFAYCSNLSNVYFNATNCTTMGGYNNSNYVFAYCSKFEILVIGANVTNIPNYAFYSSYNGIKKVISYAYNPPIIGSQSFNNAVELKVSCAAFPLYLNAPIWQNFNYVGSTFYNGKNIAYSLNPSSLSATIISLFPFVEEEIYNGDIEIPATVNDCNNNTYTVTAIADEAFKNMENALLTSVTIPNSVTSIGNSAFQGCTGLTSITIPNSVTSIQSYAFANTGWYNNHSNGVLYLSNWLIGYKGTMPANSNISILPSTKGIAIIAFYGCTNLTSITIPNSVTVIGDYAFGNTGLTSLTSEAIIPPVIYSCEDCSTYYSSIASENVPVYVPCESVNLYKNANGWRNFTNYIQETDINGKTLYYTTTSANTATITKGNILYNGNIDIPAHIVSCDSQTYTVTQIAKNAFKNCSNLTSVTIPKGVTSIGDSAFYNCDRITTVNFNAENCTTMGSASRPVFQGCTALATLNIGGNVQKISDYAFYNCSNINSLTFPNSVETIGDYAFYGLNKIKTIETNAEYIGSNAFQNCTLLHKVIAKTVDVFSSSFSSCPLDTLLVGNISGSLSSFTSLKKLALFNQSGFSSGFLSGCANLTDLTLPFIGTSPTATGEYATLGVLFGTTTASNGITQYYSETQQKKYAIPTTLKKLTIARSAQNIQLGYGALYGCNMLEEVTIASTVRGLGEKALYGCNGLNDIYSQWAYPPTAFNNSTFDGVNIFACTLHVPAASSQFYSVANGWKEFYSIMEGEPIITALSVPRYGGVINRITNSDTGSDNVTLNAIGNYEYSFQGWLENNSILGTTNPMTFSASAPRTIYAVFTPRENADENINIQASQTAASVSWIAVTDAANYTLVIYSDASRTDTVAIFQLDVNGNVQSSQQRIIQQNLSCNIPNLDSETQYYYSLISFDNNNFALTMSIGDFSTTNESGIDEVSDNSIIIYPNPATDELKIESVDCKINSVEIFDVSGRIVGAGRALPLHNGGQTINVSNLPAGVYLIKIETDKGTKTERFIKK
ncbi:MAG: leucine-rich repeat protein [Prevotellaceae bacterium]|jgi:hypothetical protein|nr:leucine-rich repeat protein [Prevotellaceae bacterium]